jgi:Na+-driven multidrug efflux pump
LFVALWLVRIPFAYAMTPILGADAIWWSFGVGSVVSVVLCAGYYRTGRWREAQMLRTAPT